MSLYLRVPQVLGPCRHLKSSSALSLFTAIFNHAESRMMDILQEHFPPNGEICVLWDPD
jgi:hypothetical protein